MEKTRLKTSLTGIKPTGEPHIGNYIGAIRPALDLVKEYESIYFIADYHALNSIQDPELLRFYTRSVAATWIACGLDPEKTLIYRQSDIPEIFELTTALSYVTGKGYMNRAHAYKAARDKNEHAGLEDLDHGVNMGLYNYPVLMAADILIMNADVVPVGKDQFQHVEIAADIAGSFNHRYGSNRFALTVPRAVSPERETATTLPGLDGRKMSKSYDNTIRLFVPEAELHKLVHSIQTDTVSVHNLDHSAVIQLLENFAAPAAVAETRQRLETGEMSWDEAKDLLFGVLNTLITPMRERYEELMTPGSEMSHILADGATKARARARPLVDNVRKAIGM